MRKVEVNRYVGKEERSERSTKTLIDPSTSLGFGQVWFG